MGQARQQGFRLESLVRRQKTKLDQGASMLWVRPANTFDAPVLGNLHVASWRSAYRNVLSDAFLADDVAADRQALWTRRLARPAANEHVFIAGIGCAALGFASIFGNEDPKWGSFLNNLHVRDSHQRRGIGTRLIHACARVCAESYSHAGLYLWVTQVNVKAQRFYLRHGAQNRGESTWQSPEGREVALYRFAWPDVEQLRRVSARPDG
ncbi:GNAT family N-acetyltransferase [Comamonas endophytica]|uniref:GNAT family N-acetyltransferase n=1 Tax=Comamonas endophytica TaxID=2949090 RepID=A0ABY6GHC3_9BURK|nr:MULTISPECIES: GNAT family N-acetyltransferase [unclassified Acidovorax]MCD2513333.1 GNAT family N-acetyltransferase [Acidovorax sp. D4N7]UYG53882.1 GNAT family N-acetyltransferase [Acidovorax sp. 5MLIR]